MNDDAQTASNLQRSRRCIARLQAKAQWQDNGRPLRRLREAFQPALVLLLFNILASLFFIAQILGSY